MADIAESYHYAARRSSGVGLGGGVGGLAGGYVPAGGIAAASSARGGMAQCNFTGWGRGGGRFGELARAGGPFVSGVVFDDNKIISEQHYHHGDHHHHHHQRHLHHFHDLHLIQEATETMDLRNTPEVCSRVIPSETGPMQMNLRPDLIGRSVFDNGAAQYGFGVEYRVDEGLHAAGISAASAGVAGAGGYGSYVSQYGGYGTAPALGRAGVEEEIYHHRRTSR